MAFSPSEDGSHTMDHTINRQTSLILDAPVSGKFSVVRVPPWLAASWRAAAPGSVVGVLMPSGNNRDPSSRVGSLVTGLGPASLTPNSKLEMASSSSSRSLTAVEAASRKPIVFVKDSRGASRPGGSGDCRVVTGTGDSSMTGTTVMTRLEMDPLEPTNNLYVIQSGRADKRRRGPDEDEPDGSSELPSLPFVASGASGNNDVDPQPATDCYDEDDRLRHSHRRMRQISKQLMGNGPTTVPLGDFPPQPQGSDARGPMLRLVAQALGTRALKPTLDLNYRQTLKSRFRESTDSGHRTRVNEDFVERPSLDSDPSDHLFRYYKPGSPRDSFLEHRSRAGTTAAQLRAEKLHHAGTMSDSQAKEAIFKFLESKGTQGAMLKEFQATVHVSQTVLKQVLEEIGEYQSRNAQRPRWYLKREYMVG